MAFRRFSDSCDVYCYEDSSGGFTTHFIKGRHNGIQSVNDPDLRSFLTRLKELRAQGYRFPDSVIVEIERELAGTRG